MYYTLSTINFTKKLLSNIHGLQTMFSVTSRLFMTMEKCGSTDQPWSRGKCGGAVSWETQPPMLCCDQRLCIQRWNNWMFGFRFLPVLSLVGSVEFVICTLFEIIFLWLRPPSRGGPVMAMTYNISSEKNTLKWKNIFLRCNFTGRFGVGVILVWIMSWFQNSRKKWNFMFRIVWLL